MNRWDTFQAAILLAAAGILIWAIARVVADWVGA